MSRKIEINILQIILYYYWTILEHQQIIDYFII